MLHVIIVSLCFIPVSPEPKNVLSLLSLSLFFKKNMDIEYERKLTYWGAMFAAIGTLTDFHTVLEVGESVA